MAVTPPLGSPLPQNPRFTFQTITEDSVPGPASTQCPVLPGSPRAAGGSGVAGRRTPHVPSSQCAQRMEGPRLHGGRGRARMGPVALTAVSSDAHRPSRWNPHPSASPPPLWVGLQHLSSPTPPAEPSPPASGGRWQPGLGRISDGVSDTCFGTLQCSSQTLWKIQRRLLTITPQRHGPGALSASLSCRPRCGARRRPLLPVGPRPPAGQVGKASPGVESKHFGLRQPRRLIWGHCSAWQGLTPRPPEPWVWPWLRARPAQSRWRPACPSGFYSLSSRGRSSCEGGAARPPPLSVCTSRAQQKAALPRGPIPS